MKKILFALLMTGTASFADTQTPRMGMTIPTIGSSGWGVKLNSNFNIADSSAAVQTSTNVFTSSNAFTGAVAIGTTTFDGGFNVASQTVVAKLPGPSYAFSGDKFTGVGSPAFGYAQIMSNGSPRLTVSASGNIGVVSTAPAKALDVDGNSIFRSSMTVPHVIVGTDSTNSVGSIYLNSGQMIARGDVNTVLPQYSFTHRTTPSLTGKTGILSIGLSDMHFIVNSSTAMFMEASGNIGIGTVTPGARLQVQDTLLLGSGDLRFITSVGTRISGTETIIGGGLAGGFSFLTSEVARMSLNQDGNVGISSSTPTALLVVGSGDGTLVVKSGGNVGIGTAGPTSKLDVAGEIKASTGTFSGEVSAATMTATSGFVGNGAGITGTDVNVSSMPLHSQNVNSLTDVFLASASVTLRGGRFVNCDSEIEINNNSGSRNYTGSIFLDGIRISGTFSHPVANNSVDSFVVLATTSSLSAGNHIFALAVQSDSTATTQMAQDRIIRCEEH